MRHRKHGRQFSRNTSHRRAMLRALTANLVLHERIETTDAKAKELKRVAERLITRAKRLGKVAYTPLEELSPADRSRRISAKQQVAQFLRRFGVKHDGESSEKVDLVEKVFIDLARRYEARPGGYTRIVKIGRRRGDNAPMSIVELVDRVAPRAAAGDSPSAAPAGEPPPAAPEAAPAAPEAAPAAPDAGA